MQPFLFWIFIFLFRILPQNLSLPILLSFLPRHSFLLVSGQCWLNRRKRLTSSTLLSSPSRSRIFEAFTHWPLNSVTFSHTLSFSGAGP
ncbi:hypothetical protein BDQ94DRAFT_138131 [Aspergillus welwitschiae]|uniref:Secreted protein n=1 Tax=Aspergillus welwitschiae TaxID=1341132 RepID=A0A3F3QBU5_9EURO|nr:hypothetical protein BDQ94DRAFT_138131 [Aspergillus welwitschiae]RDH36605.1 hypothetical protein BDQ94DRAFT_138131 [Aspergillus welwitschiae]